MSDKLEAKVEKLESVVVAMSNKIFNGFGSKIDWLKEHLEDSETRLRRLEEIQHTCIASQKTEKELLIKYERRLQIYLALLAGITTFPIWKHFFGE